MDTVSFSSELFTDNTASAMTQTANEKTPTFEEAMAELEALVRKMEEGKLALEESVEAYTRGTELVKLTKPNLRFGLGNNAGISKVSPKRRWMRATAVSGRSPKRCATLFWTAAKECAPCLYTQPVG